MIKKFFLAFALLAGLLSPAYSAGTISLSLTQQIDKDTLKPLNGGKLYFFQAGTTTPQVAYQDLALTIPLPGGSVYTLDASGRIPQFFLADGQIKIRLANAKGVTQLAADNILVIGPSSGSGGGSTVDPTTVIATGDLKARYGTGVLSGFVRANGRTIGSATSGATERANLDCQALFEYLWAEDTNLTVSTGRGASANADWVANKAITLPDWRGRALAALDDMGNSAAGRLTATYFGTSAIVLGAAGGAESKTLLRANLPPYTPSGTIVNGGISFTTNAIQNVGASGGGAGNWGSGSLSTGTLATISSSQLASGFFGTAQGGTSTPLAVAQPTMLATIYLKL